MWSLPPIPTQATDPRVFRRPDEVDWEPRYNIAPSQSAGIIRQDRAKPERRFSLARWGLIPYWAKDPGIVYKLINARSETVAALATRPGLVTIRTCSQHLLRVARNLKRADILD